MNRIVSLAAVLALAAAAPADEPKECVLEHIVKDIDGKDVDLAKYKGQVLLIVNTASKCGLTPQYEALEALHDKYGKDGLQVLAFPANEFGAQEPGSNPEIKEFCKLNYEVSFPLFSKIVVKGDGIDPLYEFLTSTEKNGQLGGPIAWNFTKFLVDREGNVIQRFEPRVTPDDPEVVKAIEAALAAK